MPDYNDWIIRRLEGDLDIARKEADVLRAKLDAREERVRELELKLNRFEVERELESEEPEQSLSDKFDPESIGKMADKLAPFAMVLGDIMRTIKPAIASQPAMQPPIPDVHPAPFGASAPIPDDSHLLFPNLGSKQ